MLVNSAFGSFGTCLFHNLLETAYWPWTRFTAYRRKTIIIAVEIISSTWLKVIVSYSSSSLSSHSRTAAWKALFSITRNGKCFSLPLVVTTISHYSAYTASMIFPCCCYTKLLKAQDTHAGNCMTKSKTVDLILSLMKPSSWMKLFSTLLPTGTPHAIWKKKLRIGVVHKIIHLKQKYHNGPVDSVGIKRISVSVNVFTMYFEDWILITAYFSRTFRFIC